MRADPDQEDADEAGVSSVGGGELRCSPTPPNNNNPTPLLKATLAAPPQSYLGGVRVKAPSDLRGEEQGHHHQQQSEFYTALLKQLRQQASNSDCQAAGRKRDRSQLQQQKSLPFKCPACKKRFQRHIAMNAHFQNEHISGPGASGERGCRLCGAGAASMAALRLHLLAKHGIDLDNPGRSDEGGKYSVLEASLRSGTPTVSADDNEPSCSEQEQSVRSRSSSPASPLARPPLQPTPPASRPSPPSSGESPERCLFPIKQETSGRQGGQQAAEQRQPEVEETAASSCKRPRLWAPASSPRFTCHHCHIVYPNQTLYFLHKGFHSDSNPWRCNGCGHVAEDLYDFNSHLFSAAHQ